MTCEMVDMVEISGVSAEQNEKGRLLGSFSERSLAKAPVKKEDSVMASPSAELVGGSAQVPHGL